MKYVSPLRLRISRPDSGVALISRIAEVAMKVSDINLIQSICGADRIALLYGEAIALMKARAIAEMIGVDRS